MKRLFAAGAMLVIVGAVGLWHGPISAAQSAAGFSLNARADSIGLHPVLSQAPLLPGGDIGFITPASAQASLDSFQTSRAFASAPYAGDFITTLPGTFNGLGSGKLPTVEPFPFYVASEAPSTPVAERSIGPYSVRAASDAKHSAGTSQVGISTQPPQVAAAVASADVSLDDSTGLLTATATTSIEPLAIAPNIRLGDIHTTATLTYDPANPDEGITKNSSLTVGTINISGLELGITDKGLVLNGSPLLPIDLSVVTNLLSQAGIAFAYVPGTETDTSITSAAVSIAYTTDLPSVGATTATAVLGQVSATLDPRAPFSSLPAPLFTPTPISTVAAPNVATAPRVAAALAPPAVMPTAPAAAPSIAPRVLPIIDVRRFYPVLIVGGLVMMTVARLRVPHRRAGLLGGAHPCP